MINYNIDIVTKILDNAFILPINKEETRQELGLTNPRYYRYRNKWKSIRETENTKSRNKQTLAFFEDIPAQTLLVTMNKLNLTTSDLFN